MKTPREILFARHQSATPKLDDIRHAAVGKLNNEATKQQSSQKNIFVSLFLGCSKNVWHELILPSRRIWTGLAAVWILILAVNLSLRDHPPMIMAKIAAPEIIPSLQQQEQMLTELTGSDEPALAEPQKSYTPRPSSQRLPEILIT